MGVGGWRHAPASLPRKRDPVPIVQNIRWAPGSVWTDAEKPRPPPPPGFDPWSVQPVASCYTNYAIPAHNSLQEQQKNIHKRLAIECWVANNQRQVDRICLMFLVKHLNDYPSISFGLQPGKKYWLSQLHRLFSARRPITNDKRWRMAESGPALFRHVRKTAKRDYQVRHIRPSVPMEISDPTWRISWNLIHEDFSKVCWENSSLTKLFVE